MSTIFPGNYVASLNAYRGQGVFALPGVEFYQAVGVAILSEDVAGSGALSLEILSPDLRQDDKPRLDKPFVVPAGATVYRTAISAVNVETSGSNTVAVDGLTTAGMEASLAASGGTFPSAGVSTVFDGFATVSTEGSDAVVTAAYTDGLSIVNVDDQACVLVEICYFLDGSAPSTDDVHLPYKTEAGQGY